MIRPSAMAISVSDTSVYTPRVVVVVYGRSDLTLARPREPPVVAVTQPTGSLRYGFASGQGSSAATAMGKGSERYARKA